MKTNPTILVVGAGPTGLFFAQEMIKKGHKVRIIDRKPILSQESKALGIHARTLEIFDQVGLGKDFLKEGRVGKGLKMHIKGDQGPTINFAQLPTPHPYVLFIGQNVSERILHTHLETAGGRVEWQTELVGIHEGVCSLKKENGTIETCQPTWIIGADGSRSKVRSAMGSQFIGKGIDRTFVLLDIRGDISIDNTYLHTFVEGDEPFALIPFPPEEYRLIFASQAPDQEKEANYTPAFIESLIKKRCGRTLGRVKNVDWISFFKIRTCLANRFHKGNSFIMGDAAHVHSPMGAQGMNMSLQDAFNLAWKLDLVIKKAAPLSLLDSYEIERKYAIEKILKGTERGTEMSFVMPAWARAIILPILNQLTRIPHIRNKLVFQISQLGVCYPKSPIVYQPTKDRHWAGPKPGERAPFARFANGASLFSLFRHQKHTLLLFSANSQVSCTAAAYAPWIDVQVIDDPAIQALYAADTSSVYLIRPDGYIAYRSRRGCSKNLTQFLSLIFLDSHHTAQQKEGA